MAAAVRALEAIGAAHGHRAHGQVCASCHGRIDAGDTFHMVVVFPAVDAPNSALAMPVCGQCAGNQADLDRRAEEIIRTLRPQLRLFSITHPEGGRA